MVARGNTPRHEVMIAGEILAEGGRSVMRTLLHEAAHALAVTRKVQETSRGARWHNGKFKALAEELGLVVEKHATIGHITPDMTDETARRYAAVITSLDQAIKLYRRAPVRITLPKTKGTPGGGEGGDGEGGGDDGETVRGKKVTASCRCDKPRKLSMAAGVWAAGPVVCGVCGAEFSD